MTPSLDAQRVSATTTGTVKNETKWPRVIHSLHGSSLGLACPRARSVLPADMNVNAVEFQQDASSAEDEVVARLKALFPAWNRKHLTSVWTASGRNWNRTIQEIHQVESEIQGTTSSLVGTPAAPYQVAPRPAQGPAVAADAFPTLGAAAAPAPSHATTSSWALKARQSASNAPNVAPRLHPPGSLQPAAPRAPPTRDVWESGGRIHQFQTGHAVSHSYAVEREHARDLALARNTLFEEATRAYQRGDKKLAKDLGAKGREYNALMHAAHETAARTLFDTRNASVVSGSGRRTIDLHGLHVREAIRALSEVLDDCKRRSEPEVDVVVGTGRHSTQQRGVLRRSIIEHVVASGYRYTEQYAGCITVLL